MKPLAAAILLALSAHAQFVNPANGHTYVPTSQPLSYFDARLEAQSLGGHLVTIGDAAENSWLVATFSYLGTDVWTGLTDEASEGTFVWDSGEPVGYTNWYPGEPNDLAGEDYVPLDLTINVGTWADGDPTPPLFGVIELSNLCLDLDGADDLIDFGNDPSLVFGGAMSIEWWMQIDSYPTNVAELLNKKSRDSTWKGFIFHLQNGVLEFGLHKDGETCGVCTQRVAVPWTVVPLGQWTHVAGVFDGSLIELFVNGVSVGSTAFSGTYAPSPTNPLRFGRDSEAPTYNPNTFYDGRVDEIRMWDVARTSSEIVATMDLEIDSHPGLVGAWHLNGSFADTTGMNHGSPSGGPLSVVSTVPFREPYFGSGEDVVLATGVNAPATPTPHVKIIMPGDALTLAMSSPLGGYDFTVPVIAAQGFATGSPPLQVPGLDEVWFDLFPGALSIVLLYDGWAAPFPPGVLAP